jgi:starvation-inducible DNA-binding protein
LVLPNFLLTPASGVTVRALHEVFPATVVLRDMYQNARTVPLECHSNSQCRLFERHYAEQASLVDELAERIESLAGMSNVLLTKSPLENCGNGKQTASELMSQLLEAHEETIRIGSEAAADLLDLGDQKTGDFLVTRVLRTNEFHVWYLAQQMILV